ncbi:hypothetical protein [Nostoc sp.]
MANLPTEYINNIDHPPFEIKHKEADLYTFDYVFGGKAMKEADTIYNKLRRRASNAKQYIKKLLTN